MSSPTSCTRLTSATRIWKARWWWRRHLFYGSSPNILKSLEFNAIYLTSVAISGAILAGVVGWLLVRALAKTGALSRFAAGRELAREV